MNASLQVLRCASWGGRRRLRAERGGLGQRGRGRPRHHRRGWQHRRAGHQCPAPANHPLPDRKRVVKPHWVLVPTSGFETSRHYFYRRISAAKQCVLDTFCSRPQCIWAAGQGIAFHTKSSHVDAFRVTHGATEGSFTSRKALALAGAFQVSRYRNHVDSGCYILAVPAHLPLSTVSKSIEGETHLGEDGGGQGRYLLLQPPPFSPKCVSPSKYLMHAI